MTLVRIVKENYSFDWLNLTPNHSGLWDGIQFTEDEVDDCDYLVILNRVERSFEIKVPPANVWAIMQEPPVGQYKKLHRSAQCVKRVYTQDTTLKGSRYIYSQPALPWLVKRTYDQLRASLPPTKSQKLSWITSNKAFLPGHKQRLAFLDQIQDLPDLHLYGRGYHYIEDKWDALAPYQYSLAIENFQNDYYWTEKLADCFLTWTMPIYFGCTRIEDYFPKESFVTIDINDPKSAIERIQEVINSNHQEKNFDAIVEARRRVIEEYQLFPFLANEIKKAKVESQNLLGPSQKVLISNQKSFLDTIVRDQATKLPQIAKNRFERVVKRIKSWD